MMNLSWGFLFLKNFTNEVVIKWQWYNIKKSSWNITIQKEKKKPIQNTSLTTKSFCLFFPVFWASYFCPCYTRTLTKTTLDTYFSYNRSKTCRFLVLHFTACIPIYSFITLCLLYYPRQSLRKRILHLEWEAVMPTVWQLLAAAVLTTGFERSLTERGSVFRRDHISAFSFASPAKAGALVH